jgi:hypothetical protein
MLELVVNPTFITGNVLKAPVSGTLNFNEAFFNLRLFVFEKIIVM